MSVVELLLENAVEDNHLLMKMQGLGDRLDCARDLDFVLYAKDEKRAKLVASFVKDNRYGKPSVRRIKHAGEIAWRLLVVIHAPATEHVVHTLSAFMTCLAGIYDLEYEGWGCGIEK